MNTFQNKNKAKKIWFDKENMWVLLKDGRQLAVPLKHFPRLFQATPEQRNNFKLSGGGIGIHWEQLDEDISIEGLLLGIGDQTNNKIIESASTL